MLSLNLPSSVIVDNFKLQLLYNLGVFSILGYALGVFFGGRKYEIQVPNTISLIVSVPETDEFAAVDFSSHPLCVGNSTAGTDAETKLRYSKEERCVGMCLHGLIRETQEPCMLSTDLHQYNGATSIWSKLRSEIQFISAPNTPADGGTCDDPDPSTQGGTDYQCTHPYQQKVHVSNLACKSFPSCNSNCCDLTPGTCDEAIYERGYVDYRGCQNQTRSGHECQKWSSQSPYEHGYTMAYGIEAGFDGLGDHNFCRDPDGAGYIWCYTTTPYGPRWDRCVPKEVTANSTQEPDSGNWELGRSSFVLAFMDAQSFIFEYTLHVSDADVPKGLWPLLSNSETGFPRERLSKDCFTILVDSSGFPIQHFRPGAGIQIPAPALVYAAEVEPYHGMISLPPWVFQDGVSIEITVACYTRMYDLESNINSEYDWRQLIGHDFGPRTPVCVLQAVIQARSSRRITDSIAEVGRTKSVVSYGMLLQTKGAPNSYHRAFDLSQLLLLFTSTLVLLSLPMKGIKFIITRCLGHLSIVYQSTLQRRFDEQDACIRSVMQTLVNHGSFSVLTGGEKDAQIHPALVNEIISKAMGSRADLDSAEKEALCNFVFQHLSSKAAGQPSLMRKATSELSRANADEGATLSSFGFERFQSLMDYQFMPLKHVSKLFDKDRKRHMLERMFLPRAISRVISRCREAANTLKKVGGPAVTMATEAATLEEIVQNLAAEVASLTAWKNSVETSDDGENAAGRFNAKSMSPSHGDSQAPVLESTVRNLISVEMARFSERIAKLERMVGNIACETPFDGLERTARTHEALEKQLTNQLRDLTRAAASEVGEIEEPNLQKQTPESLADPSPTINQRLAVLESQLASLRPNSSTEASLEFPSHAKVIYSTQVGLDETQLDTSKPSRAPGAASPWIVPMQQSQVSSALVQPRQKNRYTNPILAALSNAPNPDHATSDV